MQDVAEWQAYYRREPWGHEAPYIGMAQLTAIVANALRGRGERAFKAADFIPSFQAHEQTPEEMWEAWVARRDLINQQLSESH